MDSQVPAPKKQPRYQSGISNGPPVAEELSEEPPLTQRQDFLYAKLRQFPHSEPILWKKYCGSGEEGIVFKVMFGRHGPYAMKVVSFFSFITPISC